MKNDQKSSELLIHNCENNYKVVKGKRLEARPADPWWVWPVAEGSASSSPDRR